MPENNMSVFTTKIKTLPDLVKQYLFQVHFKFENKDLADLLNAEDMMLKAKTAAMPGKSLSEIVTEFMGSKLVYPGKATVDGELSITFDEFQNMDITTTLHRWQNLLFNHAIEDDIDAQGTTGGAYSNVMSDYAATITVDCYDSTLRSKLPVSFQFMFAWPKDLSQAELNMESDGKVQRQVTFRYSTFKVISNV